MHRFLLLLLVAGLFPGRAEAQGMIVYQRDATPGQQQQQQQQQQSPPQRVIRQQPLQASATPSPSNEYRGYNNRNMESAYFTCRYEAVRAMAPGETGRDPIRKVYIRQSVMEACMNREGFFRKGRAPLVDLSLMSFNDWWYGW
ncbi:MAG: hypothetical protein ACK5O9_07240 [Holosporales bacterium]|jgi:hypothetical protein